MSGRFDRTVKELRERASMFWPSELSAKEAKLSIIPELIKTQNEFIAVLSFPVSDFNGLFSVMERMNPSKLAPSLFLKHLVVLADFGGEKLQRLNTQFEKLFPDGEMIYVWEGKEHRYQFRKLPVEGSLTNDKLGISARRLFSGSPFEELHRDVVAILLFGAACNSEEAASFLEKCKIGDLLGRAEELEEFVKQRYIWVSRITGGSQANTLGQIAQAFVKDYLEDNLCVAGAEVRQNGRLPNVTHTDDEIGRSTSFDLVVSRDDKRVAIEVSFQETTNSTIERKGGQARARFEQIEKAGHRIAYVIDGAGNFQRVNALENLVSHSHCTVALSEAELEVLCDFLRDYLSDS